MASRGGVPDPRPIKTSELKSRILNVATPNNYLVRLNPPQVVQSFMGQRGIPYPTFGETIELRCINTTTPGTSFLTHSVANDYQGVVEEIPYRRAYENTIEMTFMVDTNYETQIFFEAWVDYMSGIGAPISRDAYPKQINSMELNYGPADDFLRLTVTFGYSRYISERINLK